ncbi:zinc-binding dehydrogenase [Streptomyces sp. NPDC092046]|uniref:zinc-binding dehydrogenase n=1 Tax=Streptomyces sp. NPDC092046 TaxID=3366009 RepID=UPI00381D9CED
MGSYAVQLAKAEGAVVMGVCSTGKTDLVRRLGADHVVDYTREEFAAVGSRHDLVLDIAGNRPLPLLLTALAPGGRLVLVLVGCEGGSRSSARCTGHCGPLRPERPAVGGCAHWWPRTGRRTYGSSPGSRRRAPCAR